jgi:DNA polymerase
MGSPRAAFAVLYRICPILTARALPVNVNVDFYLLRCIFVHYFLGEIAQEGLFMNMREPLPLAVQTAVDSQHVLHRDIETRSMTDLRKVGVAQYAANPSTEILVVAYAVDEGPVQLWRPGDPIPIEFHEAAPNPNWLVCAHNDGFESNIEEHVLRPRFGWPITALERHRCTMAMCLALGLPAKLSLVADVLELANRKDAAGERLMHQMSKPRRARKDEDPAVVHWFDDQERLQRLYDYCRQDVKVERELYYRLPSLPAAEQTLWASSCAINSRGFCVDRKFAEAARRIAQAVRPEIDTELAELTDGVVTGINQIARLQQWLQDQGCPASKLDRRAVERLLETEDLPPKAHRALELRLGGAQAATKKIDALLARAGADDRVRGAFKYHGAATGRFSSEGFQAQNLKRPVVEDLAAAIDAVATGDIERVKALDPRPLAVIGNCIRPMIVAAEGHVLIGADFSSIESRMLAWLASENWKLDSYRRFDATKDPRDEPYCVTACKIFGKPPGSFTKDSPERGVGKVCDLAFGYQGGLAAWRNFEPDKFTDTEVETFKADWRAAHPATVRFWHQIDNAAVLAVRERGEVVRCSRVDLKCVGSFLFIKLPSGRKISYPQPRLINDKNDRKRVVFSDNSGGRFIDCRHGQGAYGGLWAENIVSGIARDLLAAAMLRIEAAGYPIVLHVHDELVCDVPLGFGNVEEFSHLMTRKPAWALELPIAASAWTGSRYCK